MLARIPAVLTRDSYVSLALISLATFAYSCWAVNILTLPADLFPNACVASVSGLAEPAAPQGKWLLPSWSDICSTAFLTFPGLLRRD